MDRLTTYKTECNREMICRFEDCDVSEEYCPHLQEDNCLCLQEVIKKLGQYEDAEEQGLLPIFHLGDEFWTKWLGKPLKAKIVMLQQKKNGIWKYRFCDEQSHTHDYEENEFGKYFWTTKEEAEQALKQMGE